MTTTVGKDLLVKQDSTLQGKLDVSGQTTIGADTTINGKITVAGQPTFSGAGTTGSSPNAVLAGGLLLSSTSSKRFKKDVEDLSHQIADNILNIRPIWYRSLSKHDPENWSYYGFIAEEVAEIDPRLVRWEHKDPSNLDSELIPQSVQYERLVVPLLDIVKRQQERIEQLEKQVNELNKIGIINKN